MITQVAAEQEMIDSGVAEPHWRTLQAYEVDFWDSVWAWRPARGGARGEL